jgi:signal transduction histidine kinase
MPLGPSAALEICGLATELEDRDRCLQTSTGLYRSLLRREWDLEKAEFELFAERAKAFIESALSISPAGADLEASRTEFQALQNEEAAARRRTERALAFNEGAAPALAARAKTANGTATEDGRFSRTSLTVGPEAYLVSIQRISGQAGGMPVSPWGIIIDAERLRQDVLRPALGDRFPPETAAWALKGRDGAALMSSGSPATGPAAYRANFASDFPDWTIEFQQPSSPLIKSFLLSRRGLYFFVFLLIAGILVFGLALTLRSVSHELELARMKSDFVSTVSHEFKSPLTSIRQLAEMLQAGRVPSEEKRQKYYDVLLEQSERLTLLTDNILSLARIEEGRAEFKFETTDIAALLAEVVASFQERVRHEGFTIGLEVDDGLPSLAVDRTALSQALTNLVDNAVKYSGDSREISVRASVQGPFLTIAVRDRGVGIKAEDLDRVFERFYRAGDGLTRTVKGSGLGLTLVKEIVAAHRGDVRVESEPGEGSVFSIRLPLVPVKEGRP